MSTATVATPVNGAASTERARNIVHESLSNRFATSPVTLAKSAYSGARTWVTDAASRFGVSRGYSWARSNALGVASMARELLATIGVGNTVVFSLTTDRGRRLVFRTIPETAYRTVTRPLGFVLRPVRNLLLRFAAGRRIVGWFLVGQGFLEGCASEATSTVDGWLADRHDHPVMRAVRSFTAFMLFRRVISMFLPAGWMSWAAQGVAVFIPTSKVGVNGHERTDSIALTVIDHTLGLIGETKDGFDGTLDEFESHSESVMRSSDIAARQAEASAAASNATPAPANRAQRRASGQSHGKPNKTQQRARQHRGPVAPAAAAGA